MKENIYAYSVWQMALGHEVSVNFETKTGQWRGVIRVSSVEKPDEGVFEQHSTRYYDRFEKAETELDSYALYLWQKHVQWIDERARQREAEMAESLGWSKDLSK